jgi:hypothetical protein
MDVSPLRPISGPRMTATSAAVWCARDPRDMHAPLGADPEFNFSFDPRWMRLP